MILKGVSHIHSRYSFDGKLPLEDVRKLFEEKGINFILMSEHVETMPIETIRAFIADCKRLSTPRCLVIPGLELEFLNLLVFGIQAVGESKEYGDLIREFEAQGAVFVLSHPAKLHAGALASVSKTVEGVEIWNCKYDGKTTPRPKSLRILKRLRRTRRRLIASCGIDFHSASDYAPVWLERDSGELSQGSILAALRAGQFRVVVSGHSIPTEFDAPLMATAGLYLKGFCCTSLYDTMYYANLLLTNCGIEIPYPVKRFVKRFI